MDMELDEQVTKVGDQESVSWVVVCGTQYIGICSVSSLILLILMIMRKVIRVPDSRLTALSPVRLAYTSVYAYMKKFNGKNYFCINGYSDKQ